MVSEEYFKNLLGDLYNFSLFKFLHGEGHLYDNSNPPIPIRWGLCVDVSGNKILALSTEGIYINDFSEGNRMKKLMLEGKSNCNEWRINTTDLVVISQEYSFETNCTTLRCIFNQLILEKEFSRITSIKAHLTNFHFLGLESSCYGKRRVMDKFSFTSNGRNIEFKLNENANEVKKMITSGRISAAIMSTLTFNVFPNESLQSISDELDDITLFLSSLTLNTNYAQVVEYYCDQEVVRLEIANRIISKYHGNVLIDNHLIPAGLKKAFVSSYQDFKRLKEALNLIKFINLVTELQNQRFIEMKIAYLIIAFEYLLSQYLIFLGHDESEIEKLNIQQKLGKINKEFKFIPKALLKDEFRDGIRNPLFHTGTIPFKTTREKIDIFIQYYDLLMRIYLKIINVQGEYISRINYSPTSI